MAYFLPDGRTPGPEAHHIIQALRGGLIDSLHSWGDFNLAAPQPQALRSLAARLVEDLQGQGLSVKVWLNHGDPRNRQNLRARLQPGYAGDDPGSPYYTADLLKPLGLKYYWGSDLVSWPLSSRPDSPGSRLRPGINALKNVAKILLGQRQKARTTAQIMELCQPVTLRDSLPLMAFSRHLRGLKEPTSRHTLRYTLGGPVLEQLLAQEGYLILYTHLGLPRPGPGEELFPLPDHTALDRLAQHYHEGSIWVAPTVRVLNYWLITRHLVWTAHREGERLIIGLESLQDPTTGSRPPELEELAGLCFYVPPPGRGYSPSGRPGPGSPGLRTRSYRGTGGGTAAAAAAFSGGVGTLRRGVHTTVNHQLSALLNPCKKKFRKSPQQPKSTFEGRKFPG